jgi:AraC-like DNA-binding protein
MKQIQESKPSANREVSSEVKFSGQVVKCIEFRVSESEHLPFSLENSNTERLLLCPIDRPILCRKPQGGFTIIGNGEIVFVVDPKKVDLIVSKSTAILRTLSWHANTTSSLNSVYSSAKGQGRPNIFSPNQRKAEISILAETVERFVTDPKPEDEPLAFAAIQVLAISALKGAETQAYAVIPAEASVGLKTLSSEVRDHPDATWSLKAAANIAGYSQHHLSRVFRLEFGLGFPEYVDRCRLSATLENYKSQSDDLFGLAIAAGFKTMTTFRDCLKSHLGLVPTDLKRLL